MEHLIELSLMDLVYMYMYDQCLSRETENGWPRIKKSAEKAEDLFPEEREIIGSCPPFYD
jgi:hypothetical protein